MYLKRLTLKGFKSFADATTVELEPGVTVVVGPNGSGKSNIVDAVAWVLGAQGPSTVRSAKMDDVIFAGTPDRPALGRAEVTLTIDNTSGMLPIELSEVTISRTLFRSGDSEYALNGVYCRLLDIQELLSDSGVGRTQHVIVSQGNLDAILDARPEDRRSVIEEAAGILKFRRRKERAERRLAATEGNLLRLSDLLREVRRQLKPLERQADAARRHQTVLDELSAVGLYVAGRELAGLRARKVATDETRARLVAEQVAARAALVGLDADVMTAEAALTPLGGFDLGDHLVRAERILEHARGLAAVLAERRRGLVRERETTVDAGVVASLEADAARLADELTAVEVELAALVPDAERLAQAEAEMAVARDEYARQWGDEQLVLAPFGKAAELRGERAALVDGVARARSEAANVASRLGVVEAKAQRLENEVEQLRRTAASGERELPAMAAAVADAEREAASAAGAVDHTADERRVAEGEHHRWSARAEALELALDEAHQAAGLDQVRELDAVLGTLADLVEVDDGWEAAVAAAVRPTLGVMVVNGDAADVRDVLRRLAEGGRRGTVLVAGTERTVRFPPSAGEPVRRHVRARRPEAEALLDALVGDVIAVGEWPAALDLVLAQPDLVVVTRDGDRFGPDGWRMGAAGGDGATAAALEEARDRATAATEALVRAREAHDDARRQATEASAAVADAREVLEACRSQSRQAAEALVRVEAELVDLAGEGEGWQRRVAEIEARIEADEARLLIVAAELAGAEAEEALIHERAQQAQAARASLEQHAASVGALRTDVEVRSASATERREYLTGRLGEVEVRLARQQAERADAERRRLDVDSRLAIVERLVATVDARLEWIDAVVIDLRGRRQRQSEAARQAAARLDGARQARTQAEQQLEVLREQIQRSDLEGQEIALRIEASVAAIRTDYEVEPEIALAAECPELAEGVSPVARRRELERDLKSMGPINPLALEEYAALCERHDFLEGQLDDIKGSRRELAKVIRAVDEEIVTIFAGAFADVSEHFARLFETLFPGGQGRLSLVDPSDPLNTGIQIDARPSGKNVKRLSLLSGGERSLTAMAYLFSVFRSRPSPFYLMDEVEAALDDVNLHRFMGLLNEFRREAQLIVVSHQRRTMEAADCLYGVSMQPGGSSKVVSERVTARP